MSKIVNVDDKIWQHEDDFRDYVSRKFKELACVNREFKVYKIADKASSGISDYVGLYKGRFIAIEIKANRNVPTKLQELFIEDVKRCGGVAGWTRTWGGVKKILKEAGLYVEAHIR